MSAEQNPVQGTNAPPGRFGSAAPIKPFSSGHARAVWTIALLAIVAVTNIVGAGSSYSLYQSVRAGNRNPVAFSIGWVDWADNLAMVGSIVAFCLWTHRVYRNLPALGARGLRYTPGWAVGWLFVPFANLVVPYFVFAEIWRNSIPTPADGTKGNAKRISPLLIGWWILNILPVVVLIAGIVWMVVATLGFIGGQGPIEPGKAAQLISDRLENLFLLGAIVLPLISAVAAILAIFVVARIDKNQRSRHRLTGDAIGAK
jgi:hypothetical protein